MIKTSATANRNSSQHPTNKANELRQQKQKKVEANNRKVSKQLEKSADTWQNSMDQIRRIARKSHDSSQIIDNVFTENDNERSEFENEIAPVGLQRNPYMEPSHPILQQNPPFSYQPSYLNNNNNVSHNLSNNHPLSVYANKSQNFYQNYHQPRLFPPNEMDYNSNLYRSNNRPTSVDFNRSYQNVQTPMNINQNNAFNYSTMTTPLPRYYHPNIRPTFQSWQQPTFQPMSYSQNLVPPTYNSFFKTAPNYPMTPGYSYNFPQYDVMSANLLKENANSSNSSSSNSIEAMKKYVNSLLDKLELLNETVSKLKASNNSNSVRQSTLCGHNGLVDLKQQRMYSTNLSSVHPRTHQPIRSCCGVENNRFMNMCNCNEDLSYNCSSVHSNRGTSSVTPDSCLLPHYSYHNHNPSFHRPYSLSHPHQPQYHQHYRNHSVPRNFCIASPTKPNCCNAHYHHNSHPCYPQQKNYNQTYNNNSYHNDPSYYRWVQHQQQQQQQHYQNQHQFQRQQSSPLIEQRRPVSYAPEYTEKQHYQYHQLQQNQRELHLQQQQQQQHQQQKQHQQQQQEQHQQQQQQHQQQQQQHQQQQQRSPDYDGNQNNQNVPPTTTNNANSLNNNLTNTKVSSVTEYSQSSDNNYDEVLNSAKLLNKYETLTMNQ